MAGRSLLAAGGMTPRSAAMREFAPHVRFGGPRVFTNWNGSRTADTPREEFAMMRAGQSARVPAFRPSPQQIVGLDIEGM